MLSLDDLLAPVTPEQAESNILTVASQLGLPVTAWQSGGVARTLVKVVSRVYAGFTQVAVLGVQGGFLDYATGNWLTLLAKNVYNVDRITATFAAAAQGITLTNMGGGLFVIEPGDLTFSMVNGAGEKKLYRNTSGGTLPPWAGGSASNPTLALDIQALELGTASNAAPGQINVLETTLLGVICANGVSVLGQDEETDDLLRRRCKESLGTLSPNGPKAAYEYVAKSAVRPDGVSIGITRVKIPTPPGDGSLTVYLATPSGDLEPDDLSIVDDDIQKKVVPEGVGPVLVASAVEKPIAVTAEVYYLASSGLSDHEVQIRVSERLKLYFPQVPIGGFVIPPSTGEVPLSAIIAEIESASPFIVKVTVSVPSADVTVAENEVPIYATSTINPHQVLG